MNKEDQNIEYKQSWREEYLKWVCGFANADGGRLLIGVTDDRKGNELVGVPDWKSLLETIPNLMRDTMGMIADVNHVRKEGKDNALVHKDYSSFIPIQISVSDDKLYVANVGTLPEDWTLEKLLGKHSSRPLNPTIASCVYLTGKIETWGRGIRKVFDECDRHGCPPPVYEVSAGDPGDIQVRIDAAPDAIVRDTNADVNDPSRDTNDTNLDTNDTNLDTNDTNLDANVVRDGRSAENSLPPLTLRILEMIRGNRSLTIEAMAEICHVSRPTVNRAIKALKENDRLRRVGGTRGSWEVRS